MRENDVGPKLNRITRWNKREDQRPTFHNLAEDDGEEQASRSLNHLVQRNAGAQWTEATVVVDSGAAENVMPKSAVSRNVHRGN